MKSNLKLKIFITRESSSTITPFRLIFQGLHWTFPCQDESISLSHFFSPSFCCLFIQLTASNRKVWFLSEMYTIVDYFTIPSAFIALYLDHNWSGMSRNCEKKCQMFFPHKQILIYPWNFRRIPFSSRKKLSRFFFFKDRFLFTLETCTRFRFLPEKTFKFFFSETNSYLPLKLPQDFVFFPKKLLNFFSYKQILIYPWNFHKIPFSSRKKLSSFFSQRQILIYPWNFHRISFSSRKKLSRFFFFKDRFLFTLETSTRFRFLPEKTLKIFFSQTNSYLPLKLPQDFVFSAYCTFFPSPKCCSTWVCSGAVMKCAFPSSCVSWREWCSWERAYSIWYGPLTPETCHNPIIAC